LKPKRQSLPLTLASMMKMIIIMKIPIVQRVEANLEPDRKKENMNQMIAIPKAENALGQEEGVNEPVIETEIETETAIGTEIDQGTGIEIEIGTDDEVVRDTDIETEKEKETDIRTVDDQEIVEEEVLDQADGEVVDLLTKEEKVEIDHLVILQGLENLLRNCLRRNVIEEPYLLCSLLPD